MKLSFAVTTALLLAFANTWATESEIEIEQARQASLDLGKTLKQELLTAMQTGGPVEAIAVCNLKAMPLAEQISQETGWQVGRTSLRVRNPANTPDDWERQSLQQFQARLEDGEPLATIEAVTTQQRNGKTVQRFMKAIAVQAPCLACHGTELAPAVAQKLDALYPNDRARGYQLGDLRGAFTLERVISAE